MTSDIYALLVGIDNYAAPVSPLQGCINDVMAVEEYLKTRVKTEGWNLRAVGDRKAT
jgi:Caspase domain